MSKQFLEQFCKKPNQDVAKVKPDLRGIFRLVGSTEIDPEYFKRHTGVDCMGATLIEVLVMKLYRKAIEDDDYSAIDRVLRFYENQADNSGGASVNINMGDVGSMGHGAVAIMGRLKKAIDEPQGEIIDNEPAPDW